jgi:hypothetical protein
LQAPPNAACLASLFAKHRELADDSDCAHRLAETIDDSASVSTNSFCGEKRLPLSDELAVEILGGDRHFDRQALLDQNNDLRPPQLWIPTG